MDVLDFGMPLYCGRCAELHARRGSQLSLDQFRIYGWGCEQCRRLCRNAGARRYRAVERGTMLCADCGKIFTPKRTDAKFCCAACKQRAYRKGGDHA